MYVEPVPTPLSTNNAMNPTKNSGSDPATQAASTRTAPDGRVRLVPVEHRPAVEDVDASYPVYLTAGRVLQHHQSGAQTRRIGELSAALPKSFVEIHPDLAARHGVTEGDLLRVISRRGACAVGLERVAR